MNRDYSLLCMRTRILALPFLILLGISTASVAFADDTTPPSVTGLALSPTSVDVTTGPKSVLVTMTATDDLSGVKFVTVTFTSPHVSQTQFAFLSLSGGTATNGTFTGNATIPQYADNGTWNISSVFIGDNAGNSINIPNSTLMTIAGVATTLPVVSVPDTQAPTVVGMPTFSPNPINVSAGDQTLTMTFAITDDVSGVDFSKIFSFAMTLQSPTGIQHQYISKNDFSKISGTTLSGTWQVTHVMPQYSEAGTWSIASLTLFDAAGNQRNVSLFGASQLPAQFTVTSSPQDTAAPTLTSFDFTPKFIDTSAGAQNVTVTLNATDDLSGVDFSPDNPQISTYHGFQFQSPSHGQNIFCCAFSPTFNLTGGTAQSGTWQATVSLPQFSEEGTWKASILQLKDRVENNVSLTSAQLAGMALPTDLIIIKPSAASDGTIGTGGGTVTDTASTAQLTLPAGAVTSTTTVAIDVLSALNIPLPAGYSGFGTKFVNIGLTPLPSFPLASPGADLTLPLPAQGAPGQLMHLFSVDPNTGTLVPVASTAGGNVTGTVNANGLAAFFAHASHASTFVGLIPATTDTTPPVIAPNITGTLGNNSWFKSNVSVSWTVTDAESAISSSTGCSSTSLTTDTNGTVLTCMATSAGGTNSQSVTIKIDKTAPTVTYSGNKGTYNTGDTINITCTASDGSGSGIASSTCQNISGPASSFNLGVNSYSATATDNAGNQGGNSTSFTVLQNSFADLIALVNQYETKPDVAAKMVSTLLAAQSAFLSGNVKTMDNQLSAFINQVKAQSGKSLSSAQAATLIALAQALEA